MKLTVLSVTPIEIHGKTVENVELVTDLQNGLGGHMVVNTKPGVFKTGDAYELAPAEAKEKRAAQAVEK